ncbi:WYL domain-containing protein [Helicobacter sp.]|uniref:helix-turn-helix transcriptional regulator n=1 Tax=Helicobacter sp. TaxID=218 RepID=UPI0025910E0F|nr:WYL domain-containing protein [Helicobacter sp.]MCI7765875.1 WYL domain-containing protein [Helicobacter sp.]
MNKDNISTRIAIMISRLYNGEVISLKELAEEFNTSYRTLQRDIARLHFFPIKRLPNGKYTLEESELVDNRNAQMIRKFAALSGLKNLYPNLSDDFIVSLLNDQVNHIYQIKPQAQEDMSSKNDLFEELSVAILQTNKIEFDYINSKTSSISKRTAAPYKLINKNGIWYLIAENKGQLKHFALRNIINLVVLKTKFKPKQECLNLLDTQRDWVGDCINAKILIIHRAKEYFLRKPNLKNFNIIKEDEMGLIISANFTYEDELLNFIKSWIPCLFILEPKDLAKKLENELKSYLNDTLCHLSSL